MPIVSLFHLSIVLYLSLLAPNIEIMLAIILFYLIYYRKQLHWFQIPIIILFVIISTYVPERTVYDCYQVIDAKDKYAIIQNESSKYLIYYEDLDVGDIVYVYGNPSEIMTSSTFNQFDFSQYLKSKNITHYYKKDQLKSMQAGDGLIPSIYAFAKQRDEIAYRILSRKSIDDVSFSLSISYLLFSIRLRKIISPNKLLIFSCLLLLVYEPTISVIFFICDLCIRTLFSNKMSSHNRFGACLIIAMMLVPSSVTSFSFILLLVLRSAALLYPPTKFQRYLIIILMFFIFQGEVDLVSLLCYPLVKGIELLCYILACCSLLVPIFIYPLHFVVDNLTKLFEYSYIIYYVPGIVVITFWMIKLIEILNKKRVVLALIQMIVICIVLPYINPIASVEFINVGQGDSTLIIGPYRRYVIMIDAAGSINKDIASDILIPRLKQLRINHIDSLVVTHDDFDHNGSVDALIDNFTVSDVVTSETQALSSGTFEVVKGLGTFESDNDNSLIIVGSHYGLNYFFGGDAGILKEELFSNMYDYQVDILKLSHHGSDTSTSKDFLHRLNPLLAVVSAGIDNRYQHPSKRVVDDVTSSKIHLVNTATHGSIRIDSLLFFHVVRTSKKEFAIIITR